MKTAAIVNGGNGAWAFEDHARRLSRALWVEISEEPRDFNYYLHLENAASDLQSSFIPVRSIQIASDKREVARAFLEHAVPSPETYLLATRDDVRQFLLERSEESWCLKWPTGCGAAGHRMISLNSEIEDSWPAPYVIQRFIKLAIPAVYRTYCVGREIFGWTLRKFGDQSKAGPWVSHAKGARYEPAGPLPEEARQVAEKALKATGLFESFGCVDFIESDAGWLALEVGTDGVFNHVDRDFSDQSLEDEINWRIAEAFWKSIGAAPWAPGPWRYAS